MPTNQTRTTIDAIICDSMATGVKRSLFSKPAWAAPAASTIPKNDESSIFGRNVVYEDMVQVEKAKREKKAARAKKRAEGFKREGSESKRRRTSTEKEDGHSSSSGFDFNNDARGKNGRAGPVTRSTPKKEKKLREGPSPSSQEYQSPRRRGGRQSSPKALDEEDDDLVMLTTTRPKKTSPKKQEANDALEVEDSEEEDEYIRELKRKAREKAQLQRQGVDVGRLSPAITGSSTIATTRSPSKEQGQSRPVSSSSIQEFARQTPASEQEDDPQVKILIQSDIPNTTSLIVVRKASQSLKQVREFWCRKFEFDESMARNVFFTWKGTRLFDSTTMRGIIRGLKNDARQRSSSMDADDDEDFDDRNAKDPSAGHILLEATTDEIYQEKQQQKERRGQRMDASASEADEDTSTAPKNREAQAEEKDKGAVVIKLVSRDFDSMQLRVRPHTTIGKIMRGFAATKNVEEGKTPWLIFDGERLDPEQTVEEVGFEEEDEVEVSIR